MTCRAGKRGTRLVLGTGSLLLATAAVLAPVACSDSSNAEDAPQQVPQDEASTAIPSVDAALDASDAADATVDVEAGARLCSDDSFCHSVVPEGQDLRGVWGDGLGIVWAFSNEGALLRWDGTAWTIFQQLTLNEGGVVALWGSGPTDLWVAVDGGLLHGTGATSATLTFEPAVLAGDPARKIKAIWGTGPNDVWAVGGFEDFDHYPWTTRGIALHYGGVDGDGGDGGGGWTLDTDPVFDTVCPHGVWGSPGSGAWIQAKTSDPTNGNIYSVVLRRVSGAAAWSIVELPLDTSSYSPKPRDFYAATLSSDNSVWLAANSGDYVPEYFHGMNAAGGGAAFTWTRTPGGYFDRPIVALWGTSAIDTWAVGQEGLVTHWNGAKWQNAAIRVTDLPVTKTFWGIWGTASDDFWIVGDEIALHKTTGGKP